MIEVKNLTHIYNEGLPHESVALDEEVIDLAHVDIAIRVAEFVGNRVVEVRPAAVEGRIEPQRVCRL